MFVLGDKHKSIIRNYPIGDGFDKFRENYSEFVSKAPNLSFSDITTLAIKDQGASRRLIENLLIAMVGLNAARELPSHRRSSGKCLSQDIADLHARFPPQCNIEAVGILLERVIEQPKDEESIWSAAYELFDEVSLPTTPSRKKSLPLTPWDPFLRDLYNDWNNDFFEDALIGLREQMRDCVNDTSEYYAKTLVFVQSSGMGKSRLADSFGRICPMISFVLRGDGDGYPPPDHQVRNFMCQPVPDDVRRSVGSPLNRGMPDAEEFCERTLASIWNHCLAFAILEASIKKFHEWVVGQNNAEISLEELAQHRHEEMKPVFSYKPDSRSEQRIGFCKAVVEEAGLLAVQLAKDKEWRHLFEDEEDSAFRVAIEKSKHMNELHVVIEELMVDLGKRPRANRDDNYLLTFVFDEAASLFYTLDSSKSDAGRYIALNRIFSCLKKFPVWFFLLSTESKVEKILPYQHLDSTNKSSARRAFRNPDQKLRVFPPFVAFPLDVEDRRKMRDRTTRKDELSKPMAKFSEPTHMAMFGRRLWYAYTTANKIYGVARLKVIGGNDWYIPDDKHHVFAILSFRLALDACLGSTTSLPLLRTAVGSFMRVVISMDQRTGFLHTTTPSEPILAYAAMKHLCSRDYNWPISIGTLSTELLHQGLIEKGLKGELFARLLLILAHDSLRGALLDLTCMPTFTVNDFLLALYHPDHHGFIHMINVEILRARMNFTHFATTDESLLSGDPTLDLCHDLLRRCAGLQLCHGNPAFDQLIPIYFGDDEKPFDRLKCGAIVIQNKNKGATTTPDYIFGEQFDKIGPSGQAGKANNQDPIRQEENYAFTGMDRPILFLLFDLGTEPGASAPVQVSCSTDSGRPPVWAIHSRGHTEAVFGCLKTMRAETVETFFAASTVERKGISHEMARRNLIFNNMTRNSRYVSPQIDGSGYGEDLNYWRPDCDNGDDDIQMKDA